MTTSFFNWVISFGAVADDEHACLEVDDFGKVLGRECEHMVLRNLIIDNAMAPPSQFALYVRKSCSLGMITEKRVNDAVQRSFPSISARKFTRREGETAAIAFM